MPTLSKLGLSLDMMKTDGLEGPCKSRRWTTITSSLILGKVVAPTGPTALGLPCGVAVAEGKQATRR
eukprot:scaffold16844_cov32-Tisochrysis_lutea.AAC.5